MAVITALAALVFCIVGARLGFRGTLLLLMGLLGAVISILLALRFHHALAQYIQPFLGQWLGSAVSLVAVVIGAFVPLCVVMVSLSSVLRNRLPQPIDRAIGALFGAVLGFLLLHRLSG